MTDNNAVARVADYFRGISGDYWKTVDEVADATRLNASTVRDTLTRSGEFVRSSYRTKSGEPLYTSREIYRTKAPFVDKLIGAFKNRID